VNVGRLVAAARAIISEFDKSQVIQLLEQAMALAANRNTLNTTQYNSEYVRLTEASNKIIEHDNFHILPNDISSLFSHSTYGVVSPARLAMIVRSGVKAAKGASMSSAELGEYRDAATVFLNDLRVMIVAFINLKLDEIKVPEGTISLDVMVPRSVFQNKASDYIAITSAFTDIMAYIQELTGGPSGGPDLVYTSTTDPVTALGIVHRALMPMLVYYDKILDVAKKQIELVKTIRTMRELVPGATLQDGRTFDDTVKQVIQKGVAEATTAAIASANSTLDAGRKSEIANAIELKSSLVVNAVSNGARMNISVESLVKIDTDLEGEAISADMVRELVAHSKALEHTVSDNLRLLDARVPLITNQIGSAPE
jgi:hypothetical protein